MVPKALPRSGGEARRPFALRDRLLRALAFAALALVPLLASPARADYDPANDSDAFIVRVTPQFDVGVIVDTTSVNLEFAMAMGATEYLVTPATVTIVGNIQPQELDLSAVNIGASQIWTLDADETAQEDQLQLYGLFAADRQSAPSESEFSGAKNLITGAPKRAGALGGSGADGNFENDSMSGAANVDNILLSNPSRQLWLRIDTPPYTTTDQVQDFQIVITATRTNM